jgi:acyl transferase domain-containing protein
LIAEYPQVTLGIYNSPRQTVIAGPTEQIDELIARVRSQNRFASRVNIEVAPHNPAMDALQPAMRAELADLVPQVPTIPIISTTYEDLDRRPAFDAEHWATNMRNPVRFQQAITVAGTDHHTFIEISAHALLTQAISETLHSAQHGSKYTSVGTLARNADDTISFRTSLNTVRTTHPPQTPHPPEPHTQIPTTPWHHTRHWLDTTAIARRASQSVKNNGSAQPTGTGGPLDDWSYQLSWPAMPLPGPGPTAPADPRRWLVIGDQHLATQLGADTLAADAGPAELAASLGDVDHVLYAPAVDGDSFDVGLAYQLFDQVRQLAAGMADGTSSAKLFLVTRNAQPVAEGDRANPAHGLLWGLGRTLALEHPEIFGAIVDFDASVPAQVVARHLLEEVDNSDGEDQVVYRRGARHVARLQRRILPTESPVTLDADTSQLVIGATGNIGPHLIRQLAQMGAKTIVAVSRNPGSRLHELTHSLAEVGTSLVTVAADATDEAAMSALFDRFGNDLPPLQGIYLAAFAGQPVLLSEMTDEDVRAMFAPKLDAAALLHRLSVGTSAAWLRHFVLFSSISGLTGSRWLAHYTATSGYLDALAYARRVMGVPATTVNWGLWKSLADTDESSQVSVGSGLLPMDDEIAIGALPYVMSPAAGVHSVVVEADWPLLADTYRARGSLHIVDDLLPAPGETTLPESEFRIALRGCDPERRHTLLFDQVAKLAAKAIGLPPAESLDPSTGFFQLGMDSLMSAMLRRSLSDDLAEPLPVSVIFDYPTVYSLTDYLATVLPEFADADSEPVADAYDELDEDALLAELSERLRGS